MTYFLHLCFNNSKFIHFYNFIITIILDWII
jgi:hypothetical protein